jgi:BlaI family penicillinase repressor
MKTIQAKLSDAEYDLMNLIWDLEPPVTTAMLNERIRKEGLAEWKAQTVITFLHRMEKKHFLTSEKMGRELYYTARISREEYLRFETENFLRRYHGNSLASFVDSLQAQDVTVQDVEELEKWLKEREG